MATKLSDQAPFRVLGKGQDDSRCCEQLSASGTVPGCDLSFTVSHVF
jgi:hypothetical protein